MNKIFENVLAATNLPEDSILPVSVNNPIRNQTPRSVSAVCVPKTDSTMIFILDHSYRDFTLWRLTLEPGCIIELNSKKYRVRDIQYYPKPRLPIISADEVKECTLSDSEKYEAMHSYLSKIGINS